jgi:DNA-binding MurR/RpiR family transcriptional regulator
MDVAHRIADAADRLTTAERRVAEVVLAQPSRVAFGTVAELAEAAGAGAATVVRLADKLGYEGFTGLQAAVQDDLSRQLRPAVERIRRPAADDLPGQVLAAETANVQSTLLGIGRDDLTTATRLLSDPGGAVLVASGDASLGVARHLAAELTALRDGVELLDGNPVAVLRRLALVAPGDTVIAIDLRRYDSWVVSTVEHARTRGAAIIAVTDSVLSPLAVGAAARFVVSANGIGPFDSHVGTLALCNLLVAAVAAERRTEAVDRLDAAEAAWRDAGALTDG